LTAREARARARTTRTAGSATTAAARSIAADRTDAQMLIAFRDARLRIVFELLQIAAVHVGKHLERWAQFAAKKVMDRHARPFSHDVPKRAVDRAHRIARVHAEAPVR